MSMTIWAKSRASDSQEKGMTPGVSQGMIFCGNVVESKVVRYDENSYFEGCLDVHDHLGEVQSLGRPGVGALTPGCPRE